ncbi:hypothetical protein HDV00_012357 [Rhizophlyctis rosea]|nr:hypothetical protein HDV00_012357 [Rhizophlyctis rosea]
MKVSALVGLTSLCAGAYAQNYLPFSYQKCDTSSGCQTVNAGLVVDGNKSPSSVAMSGSGGTVVLSQPISRSYIVNTSTNKYDLLKLKNRQVSFDVNVGAVKCGWNASFYLVQMSGSASPGSGYCDAQGTCNEMDIIEANIGGHQVTPHPCSGVNGSGSCDPNGCGVNTYKSFGSQVGPGKTIDTTKTYTVTTVFKTVDNTDTGKLASVQQTLSQNGRSVTLTLQNDSFCSSNDSYWSSRGGYNNFSQAFDLGMVGTFSFWGGPSSTSMNWLDGAPNNSFCNSGSGANTVTFANLKISYINGSSGGSSGGSQPTTTTRSSGSTTTQNSGGSSGGNCAAKWGQCGGQGKKTSSPHKYKYFAIAYLFSNPFIQDGVVQLAAHQDQPAKSPTNGTPNACKTACSSHLIEAEPPRPSLD